MSHYRNKTKEVHHGYDNQWVHLYRNNVTKKEIYSMKICNVTTKV